MDSAMAIIALNSSIPGTFHLFPLLPTEVRLKIWRATFPTRRRVALGAFDPKLRTISYSLHPHASLFVNHESRKETQGHYDTISYDYELSSTTQEHFHSVTFISPRGDVLMIDGRVTFYRRQRVNAAMCQLDQQLSASLRSIRAIEFTNLNWAVAFVSPSSAYVHRRPNIWWVIKQFPSLRNIDFVMPYASSDVYREPCKVAVEAFLEEHKDNYNGRVLPKVTFIPFAKGESLEDSVLSEA